MNQQTEQPGPEQRLLHDAERALRETPTRLVLVTSAGEFAALLEPVTYRQRLPTAYHATLAAALAALWNDSSKAVTEEAHE